MKFVLMSHLLCCLISPDRSHNIMLNQNNSISIERKVKMKPIYSWRRNTMQLKCSRAADTMRCQVGQIWSPITRESERNRIRLAGSLYHWFWHSHHQWSIYLQATQTGFLFTEWFKCWSINYLYGSVITFKWCCQLSLL